MIRDVITILGIPSLAIMWPYFKEIDTINAVLWTLFVTYTLFMSMLYISVPGTIVWSLNIICSIKAIKDTIVCIHCSSIHCTVYSLWSIL